MNRKHCSWSLTWVVGCVTWAHFITWWLYISEYLCADVVNVEGTPPDICCFLSKKVPQSGCLTRKQRHQKREKWMWQRPNESQTTSYSKDNIKTIGDKRKSVRVLWAHIANVFIALYRLLTFQCFPVKRGEMCGWSAFPRTGAQASPLWVAPQHSTSSRLVFTRNFEEMYNWDKDNVPELQYETARKPLLTWTDYCVRLPVSAELRSVLWWIFCLVDQPVTLFSFTELLSEKTLHTIM